MMWCWWARQHGGEMMGPVIGQCCHHLRLNGHKFALGDIIIISVFTKFLYCQDFNLSGLSLCCYKTNQWVLEYIIPFLKSRPFRTTTRSCEDMLMILWWCRWWSCDDVCICGILGPWFNIKMSSYQYRKSHCGDKTVVRSSYLHNAVSYTGKMISLYWFRALIIWTYFLM